MARPVVKAAGGKGQLLSVIIPLAPKSWNRYHEPFLGGGAMFFELWTRDMKGQQVHGAILNDANVRLMNCHRGLQTDAERVIVELSALAQDCSEEGYRAAVKEFNAHRPADSLSLFAPPKQLPLPRQAALFIFLSRLGFNGLYRENSKGFYNVGYCKNPDQFSLRADELRASAEALQSASLHHGDFAAVLAMAQAGDFVFMDSPYDETFGDYTRNSFTARDQDRVADGYRELDKRGVMVMATNAMTEGTKRRFKGFELLSSSEVRAINSDGNGRGNVGCMIVRNYA